MRLTELVGEHPTMRQLRGEIADAATSSLPTVIVGETGTGKELVVQALHGASGCRGELVPVNVAALPEQLAEAELFGVARGAYTGAHVGRAGLLQHAHGGTLFLDEASDLAPALQVKLLRVLESGLVRRLGATAEQRANFRLVLTLQRDPQTLVTEGPWRADFLYRVTGIVLRVPPLRDRLSDIPILAAAFLAREGRPPLSAKALQELEGHTWPGNVRELLRVIQRATLFARDGALEAEHLRTSLNSGLVTTRACVSQGEQVSLRAIERQQIERLLRETGYHIRLTAAMLGISVATLYRRLKEYGITRPDAGAFNRLLTPNGL